MIHRWDFNNDGHLDIFVAQDHNTVENEDVLIYWGRRDGPRSLLPALPGQQPLGRLLREAREREAGVTRLPSEGGGRTLLTDLNDDGLPEIVFCNFIHNYSVDTRAFIYWNRGGQFEVSQRTALPTLLASGVAAADFNRDGFVDLAFANHGSELGNRFGVDRHLESYVYWNGPAGFGLDRGTILSSVSAADCRSGDFNGDGYPDLVILNDDPPTRSVFIYWGGAEGLSKSRRLVREGIEAIAAQTGDLNGDKLNDLIIVEQGGRVEVFRGGRNGPESQPWVTLDAPGAKECAVGDLNRDGRADLALACTAKDGEDVSLVYWNRESGFACGDRTPLPTFGATDACLADFNGDGWIDVVFANERDARTYDVNSFLYWNGPDGFHAAHRRELQGFGPVSCRAADLDADGHQDLVLVNRTSGSYVNIDSLIYWGNSPSRYSAAAVTRLPRESKPGPSYAAITDLDHNGWVDIVFPTGRIFHGGPTGFSVNRITDLEIKSGGGVTTADLNRDGYLDLIYSTGFGRKGETPARGQILWGAAAGYSIQHATELTLDIAFSHAPNVADLDRDGFLDLVFADCDSVRTRIFRGGPSGTYTSANATTLEIQSASCAEFADLNADGWLDMILGGAYDADRKGRPSQRAALVWGGREGFSHERVKWLESYSANEQAVADLNRDGHLDIVMTNYHAGHTRSVPAFIYWGAEGGRYDESRRTSLSSLSSSALGVADFNRDGWFDLLIMNHQDQGDHNIGSHLYWGGAAGYSIEQRDWIPTFGPHFGVRRDVGNIYDRRLAEGYISPPVELPRGHTLARLDWKARTPHGTAVRFQLRSAAELSRLEHGAWSGPDGPKSWFKMPGKRAETPRGHQWLQYKAVFVTPDAGSTPVLEQVEIVTATGLPSERTAEVPNP
jgi:hypothetical protein